MGVGAGVAVGTWVGVRVGAKIWVGNTVFAGVGDCVGVAVGSRAEAVGTPVGAADSVGAFGAGGNAAKVPRTLASMVAWVSGVALDAPMVGRSAAGELSGVPVPWTGTQAVSSMPLISNA